MKDFQVGPVIELFASLYYLIQLLSIFVEDFFVRLVLGKRLDSWSFLHCFGRRRGDF